MNTPSKINHSHSEDQQQWLGKLDNIQKEIEIFQKKLQKVPFETIPVGVKKLVFRFQTDFAQKTQEIKNYQFNLEVVLKTQNFRENFTRYILELKRFEKSYQGLQKCFLLFLADTNDLV